MIGYKESTIIIDDSRNALKNFPDNFFQSIITSPPYWGTRDYGNINQIGLEKSLDEYLENLLNVFSEVFRVLKPNGVFWLNIGDCYTSGNRKYRDTDKRNKNRKLQARPDTPDGLKPKDLIGIPWRIAFLLQQNKWYLRSEIIWSKPNPMPESVKDRPHRSHEHLFLFSKSEKYFFNYGILENEEISYNRSVWTISSHGKNKKHIAPFPESLVKPCILSSTKKKDFILDPFFGSGTVGQLCERYNRRFVGIEIKECYVMDNLNQLKSAPIIIKK